MSDSEVESSNSSGIKIPRFHGRRNEDYGLWRLRLRAACRVKGVWHVVDTSASATSSSSTATETQDAARLSAKREKASGIIISALGDAPLRVVLEADDDPVKMLQLLDARYASNRTVSRIAVQTQLFRMTYKDQNMSTYVDQYTSLFSQLERMGKDAAIPETHKAPMLLASIDPTCSLEPTAAALRTKSISELTWDYVATTLIDEYNARHASSTRPNKTRNRRKNKTKSKNPSTSQTQDDPPHRDDSDSDGSEIETTARAFAAALKAVKTGRNGNSNGLHCDFCDAHGHTEDRCYLNPANPNNRLTPKVRQMFAAQVKKVGSAAVVESGKKGSSHGSNNGSGNKGKHEIAGATVEKTTISPPRDHRSYADSGATVHCFHAESVFVPGSLRPCGERTVLLADKTPVTSEWSGEVVIPFENANIRLMDVLYFPDLGYNLVSTGRLADKDIESTFRKHDVQLVLNAGERFYIGAGTRDLESKMYLLPNPVIHERQDTALATTPQESAELWHRRLAHISPRDLPCLHKHADDVPKLRQMKGVCRACRMGKAHKLPFPGHFEPAKELGEVVHSDILGPLEPSFPDRFQYASTFLDGYSRYTFVGNMRHRSDLYAVFKGVTKKFQELGGAKINPNYHGPVSKIHSDGAKEYIALQDSLGGGDENKSFSPPYTPELNAIAERVNRTMVEGARAMLIQADLPLCLWPYAIKHVMYVRNRVPHTATGATPYSLMTGKTPSLKHVRVFGCAAYVLRLPEGSKLESRALEGVYLETLDHGIFKVLIIDEDGIPCVKESRHVTFDESKFPGAPCLDEYLDDEAESDDTFEIESGGDDKSGYSSEVSDDFSIDVGDNQDDDNCDDDDVPALHDDSDNDDDIDDDDIDDSDDEDDDDFQDAHDLQGEQSNPVDTPPQPQQSRYPRRTRRQPERYMANAAQCSQNITVTTSDEPTLHEALNATPEERELWQAAIDEELESLESNNTWYPDDQPDAQPLPTHAILKVKRKADGSVERFKARVVAGGNHQTYGENYKETYAPVVSFTMVRIFLYLALCLQMCVGQLDVKSAFLKGDLDESVWVMSPRGIPGLKSKCFRLLKAMYGLKQAHLAWHRKLCDDLQRLGFVELPSAPCVFRRKGKGNWYDFVLVYVDDILVLSHSAAERDLIMQEFKSLYDLRVADRVELFLGVQLSWILDASGRVRALSMKQPLYAEGVLRRFGLDKSKPARTPMVESFFSGLAAEEDKSVVSVELYQQMVGSLLYLAIRTRPDISTAVAILARFQKAPTAYCHRAAKRVLRYLRGTSGYDLRYIAGSRDLNAFVDSDYAGDTMDRKSLTGFVVKIGQSVVTWSCKKQSAVAQSTCEAEYYALSMASKEIVWIARVLKESGIKCELDPVPIQSDNQAAIGWAVTDKFPSSRAKHIDVRVHFVRDLVQKKFLDVVYVDTAENDADIFTKPLGPGSFDAVVSRLGVGGEVEEEC